MSQKSNKNKDRQTQRKTDRPKEKYHHSTTTKKKKKKKNHHREIWEGFWILNMLF